MFTLASLEEKLKSGRFLLLGQIEIDEDEYEELRQYSKKAISHLTSHIFVDLRLAVFLVQVAIREYKEGRYWPCLYEVIEVDLPSNKQNTLGKVFLATIQHYKLFELEKRENSIQLFVENIKAHAFVTNWYLEGYFEFSDAYYEKNLFRILDEDIEEDFVDLSTFMKTTLGMDSDTISEKGSAKHAARSYKLLKSTRAVFSQADPELLRNIFLPTLGMIDKADSDGTLPQGCDRFEQAYKKWYQKKNDDDDRKSPTRNSGERRFHSRRPRLFADVRRQGFGLVIPQQKFRDEDCDGKASVSIRYKGKTIEHELELYRSFGIYISEELRVQVDDIFCDFDVSIIAETIKPYKIPAAIYRIFNDSWYQAKKLDEGHNRILVQVGNNVSFQGEYNLLFTSEGKGWVYYDVNISKETVCFINSMMLSVVGEFSTEPVFEQAINNYSVITSDNIAIQATRRHPVISFLVSEEKYRGTIIEINSKRYPIRAFRNVSAAKWPDKKNELAVTVRLDGNEVDQEDGYYSIVLDVPAEANKELAKYLLLKHVHFYVTGDIYMFAPTGAFVLTPGKHDFLVDPSWDMKVFPDGSEKYYFPITETMEYVDIGLKLDGQIFTLRNPVNVFAYGFSKENLTSVQPDYIWYKELRESLYLKLPGAMNVSVHLNKDFGNPRKAETVGDGLFRVDITPFVYSIDHGQKIGKFNLEVDFYTYRKKWVRLPVVLRRPNIYPYFYLDYSSKEGVFTKVSIEGPAEIYLTVKDHVTQETIISRKKIVDGVNKLEKLTPDGYYDLEPVMVESDGFFSLPEETLRPIKTGVVQLANLINCRLPVDEIIYHGREMELGKGRYFINIQEKANNSTYVGTLKYAVKRQDNGKWDTFFCGKARITVRFGAKHMTATMLLFSESKAKWLAPYFDSRRKDVVPSDPVGLQHSKENNRYILLDENDTEYVINITGIRRFR